MQQPIMVRGLEVPTMRADSALPTAAERGGQPAGSHALLLGIDARFIVDENGDIVRAERSELEVQCAG